VTAANQGSSGVEEKETLRFLIGRLYPAGRDWEPAQYRPVNERLKRLSINITYLKSAAGKSKAPLSFSYRAMRGEYCIYINPNIDPQTRMIRDLHEKGHILFNHYQRPKVHRAQFETFFRNNLHLILARLPPERNRTARTGIYSTYIYNRFSEIAQAMEINSKLFKDDWKEALPYLLRCRFCRELDAPVFTAKDALELRRRLEARDPAAPLFEECLYPKPSWPAGLDWLSYMIFLCMESSVFLDALGGGADKKIRSSDVTSYNAGLEIEDQIREQYETAVTAFETGDDSEDDEGRPGRSSGFNNARISRSVTECDDIYGLVNILRERSRCLKKSRLYTDLLYNANRNKFDANPDSCGRRPHSQIERETKFHAETLIPRRYRLETWMRNSVCILLDVSGSVPAVFIKRAVGIIIQAEGVFDKRRSRLVSWSDSLRDDVPLSGLQAVSSGGGTVLARGIEYCKQYLTENSSFFIISDFQDDLGDWLTAACGIPGTRTAIGYAKVGREVSFEQWFTAVGSNADYHRRPVEPHEFCAVFDVVLIRS
jgi:hypothetical protein